ncbi:MAG: TIGR01777 family oxidoreductase [Armatimonadota bacterium]
MPRVVIAGASGMIGRALRARVRVEGVDAVRLVRRAAQARDERSWDPDAGVLDPQDISGADAIVNLSGRGIAALWTARVRNEILQSRIRSTRLLADAMVKAPVPPGVLVSASAIGYYGDRGDEMLTESSPPGRGFLAEVTQAWEAEAQRATASGARVVCTRFGLSLARDGGVMRVLLPIFRLGLGGPVGSGRQWWSWIHLDDMIAAIVAAIRTPTLAGAVNVVAPQPVPNREFARTLAAVVRRPAVLPAPAFALRLVLRQVADEVILTGQRVSSAKLQEHGFGFRWPELRTALEDIAGHGRG